VKDERDQIEREDDLGPVDGRVARRPYVPPELVEYGTVAKLTQTGSGSVMEFGTMRRMMVCL
jgi:hypothetical protein